MDMWEPYMQATGRGCRAAGTIVFDRSHVMGYLGKAVDTVRKQEHRALMAAGDATLKGSKYLGSTAGRTSGAAARWFRCLAAQGTEVGRASAIKEALRRLALRLSGLRLSVLEAVVLLATHSRLEPIGKAAETVRRAHRQHPDLTTGIR